MTTARITHDYYAAGRIHGLQFVLNMMIGL